MLKVKEGRCTSGNMLWVGGKVDSHVKCATGLPAKVDGHVRCAEGKVSAHVECVGGTIYQRLCTCEMYKGQTLPRSMHI